ncbi:MAG: TonB-dependent receptor [Prevotella sp.]|nr:TonB-dependent receptor [Prevotella sp.]
MTQQRIWKSCRTAMPAALLLLGTAAMTFPAAVLTPAFAEEQQSQSQVTGLVTDQDKQPLIGVTVQVVGTSTMAITDADGMFKIMAPSKSNTMLEFTYLGYKKKQVKVNGAKILQVQMEEDTNEMNEVVVTGYSSQKKASIIGSIETIKPAELQFGTTRTMSNNLAGKLSGVIGIQRSGEPGYDDSDFWIRGMSTFHGSNAPLVLIDGVARDLNNVDIAEVESFSILKDASAQAMYGVRGANGVIVITTKRGKIGAPQVRFHVEHAISEPTMFPEFLNASQYMSLLNELAASDGKSLPFTQEAIDRTASGYDPDLYPDVNWIDAITKDYAHTTRSNLDISGGSDFLRYSIVASYFQEGGILEQDKSLIVDNATNNQQFNLRTNIDMDVTKTTLLRVNIGGYLNRFKKQRVDTNVAFDNAFKTLPFVHPARYSDGAIPLISNRVNPWRDVTQGGYAFRTSSKIQTLFSVEQDLRQITKGLKAKVMFSFDRWNQSERGRTANVGTVFPATGRDEEGNLIYTQFQTGDESMGSYTNGGYGNTNIYLEADLMYARRFGKFDLDALFLYNQQAYDDGDIQDYRKQGIAGRLSGTYDDRYVAEFNFGYNGSENFAKGKRFGFFPSFALGWLLSEEPFMEPMKKTFDKIKFRASIGLAGDDNIGSNRRFAYLTKIDTYDNAYTWGTTGQRNYGGINEGEYGVEGLTWETVLKKNFGVELGLFGMIDFNFDIFKENREDIFMRRNSMPTQSGIPAEKLPYANYGKMENHGVEFTLNFHKQWNKDWFTSAYGNFTFAKNKVTEFDEPASKLGTHRAQTGRSWGELFGLTADRLFTDDDFNITLDADGNKVYALKDGIPLQQVGATVLRPGDIKYIDRNNDGIITEEDEGFIGGTVDPRIVYGFGGVINYKKIDVNFFFQGVGDVYRIIGGQPYFMPGGGTTTEGNAYAKYIDDRWTEDNPQQNVFWPRLSYGPNQNNYRASTWWKKDMSFLRCKTIEVGYTLPKAWLEPIYGKSCRVFVSGNNLFCLSGFKLWDPELGTSNGLQYPLNRSIMFGLDLNF